MKRTVHNIRLDGVKHRIRIRVEGDPMPKENLKGQIILLQTLAENPALLECGLDYFHTLNIHHNGECWVAEAEAVVEAPTLPTM